MCGSAGGARRWQGRDNLLELLLAGQVHDMKMLLLPVLVGRVRGGITPLLLGLFLVHLLV
jgi:hypothetical protein